MFRFFKNKDVSKTRTDTVCNHMDASPNSVFCPKCGAKIEQFASAAIKPQRIQTVDINTCYICVLHFRCISAWITPMSYPVQKYAVVYNGKYENDFLECYDNQEKLRIIVNNEELILEFDSYTKKLPYTANEVCAYRVPISDAMESWEFIISDAPIQHEAFISGYQLKNDGLYYNTEDMQEHERRKNSFSNLF